MAKKILFEIEVENVGAARRIDALREEIKRLNKEIKGVNEGSDEYKRLTGEIARANIEIKDLKELQKQLNKEFQAAKVPADSLAGLRLEYGRLMEQIRLLTAAERNAKFGQSLIKSAAGVKAQIDGIEQSVGRFTGNVGNYRSAFGSFAQILSGGIVGGGIALTISTITQKLIEGVAAASDYGAALDRLSAITGVTGAALKDFEDRANNITTIQIGDGEIVNTAQDIFEAFTLVGSARPELLENAAALEEVTKQAIILSKASGDDLVTSVNAITTTMGQFKLPAEDSTRIINELAAGSKLGASEIVDTTVALKKFGTTAAVANVSTSESIALIETLADRQLKGEEAGTQLRNILAKLAGADILPKKALVELQEAGVSLDVLKNTALPLEARLTELGKLQGNTAALTKVFGLENLAAAQILTQGLPKYRELEAGITGTNEAFVQAGINADNTKTRIANLQAQGLNLLTQAFISAEPAIDGVIDFLSEFISVLTDAPAAIKENADELVALSFAVVAFTGNAQAAAAGALGLATAQGRSAAATAVSTFATEANTLATRALAAAQAALPLLAVVAGIYAIVKAFEFYEESATASEKASRTLAEAQGDIARESAKEIEVVRQSIEILKTGVKGSDEYKAAKERLIAINPEYVKGIDLESASIQQLDALQNRLTESIIRSVAERKKASALDDIGGQVVEQELRIQSAIKEGLPIPVINSLQLRLGELRDEYDQTAAAFDEAFNTKTSRSLASEGALGFLSDISGAMPAFTDETTKAGAAAADTAGKTKVLGDEMEGADRKTKGLKEEITAQAGSVAALRDEVSKLQKQIESTAPGSPALDGLNKKLIETKKRLEDAEKALLQSTFKSLFGRELTAPTLDTGEQPEITVQAELQPDAAAQLAIDVKAARDAAQAGLEAIEFPVTPPELSEAEKKLNAEREKGAQDQREKDEAADKEAAGKKIQRQEELKDAGIQAASDAAAAEFEIQRNNLERETEAKITALDLETQNRIQAAGGNKTKIAAIEKDAAAKREAIEREAAQERQKIAIKEALVNTALAIVKSLPNFVLAGVAAAAGLAQIAVIKSQQFADGGVVDPDELIRRGAARYEAITGKQIKQLPTGIITERPNAPKTAKGDSVLAYLAPGEMVLNEPQQQTIRQIFGQDAFALAGVPGESATRRKSIPAFASGGVVGIIPQNGFNTGASAQAVTVDAKAEFTPEQIDVLAERMGLIVGGLVERGAFNGTVAGSGEAQRLAERQAVSDRNRQG